MRISPVLGGLVLSARALAAAAAPSSADDDASPLPAHYPIRKMSFDPSEKFFDAYWAFEQAVLGFADPDDDTANGTEWALRKRFFTPPARLQTRQKSGWDIFRRATWTCSSGSYACTAIGRPNVCCPNGDTCNLITDTGHGDVGCCADGVACTGDLTGCSADQKACPAVDGGGCCNSDSVCSPSGCVAVASTTATALAATTVTGFTACPTGYYTCPASASGGCCQNGRACGVTDCPAFAGATTTATAVPVVIQTTALSTGVALSGTTTTTTIVATGALLGVCAQGWFACGAVASDGCCPRGYVCGATDCPARVVTAVGEVVGVGLATVATTLPETQKIAQSTLIPGAAPTAGVGGVVKVVVAMGVAVGAVV